MNRSFEQVAPDEATVSAYLANRLDPADAEAFEAYCLHNADFARRVELDLLFKVGLRQIQQPGAVRQPRHQRRTLLGIAACLALVVVCGALLLPRVHRGALVAYRSQTAVPSPLLSGARVGITLIRLRNGAAIHRIIAPRQTGILTVRVLPDASPGRLGYAMEAALETGVISRSVTLDNLHPDADGYLEMYLPLATLVGQTLKITVNPSPPTGAQSPSFRVEVAAAQSVSPGGP